MSLGVERDGRLGGVAQERQRLLHVQRDGVGVVSQISDRQVGAQLQVEITAAGVRESHVHDVQIVKEAPNYRAD